MSGTHGRKIILLCGMLVTMAAGHSRDRADDRNDSSSIREERQLHDSAKLLEQADQCLQMKTRRSLRSAIFLSEEILRRFPESPHAELAREKIAEAETFLARLPHDKPRFIPPFVPREFRGWHVEPEPEWLRPQEMKNAPRYRALKFLAYLPYRLFPGSGYRFALELKIILGDGFFNRILQSIPLHWLRNPVEKDAGKGGFQTEWKLQT